MDLIGLFLLAWAPLYVALAAYLHFHLRRSWAPWLLAGGLILCLIAAWLANLAGWGS